MQQSELNCTNMKLILLPLLLLLPLLVQSQSVTVDGERLFVKKRPKPTLYKLPEVPKNIGVVADTFPTDGITTNAVEYYHGSSWYSGYYNETKKGIVETPINVMDTGLKIETVETRDTIYKCPQTYGFTLFVYDSNSGSLKAKDPDCTVEKIVTTRRYKLYIINEYGQKEYLSMEITKQK